MKVVKGNYWVLIMKRISDIFTRFTFASLFLLSGLFFTPLLVHAEDESVIDEVNVTIPISCSMSGVGMNTHNATIKGKEINSAIGETTAQVFCNDNNGFAIYAVGFTDDTLGKNVLSGTNLDSTHDIVTHAATYSVDITFPLRTLDQMTKIVLYLIISLPIHLFNSLKG